jgi:hypothetical protein
MSKVKQPQRGRPRKPGKTPFNFRMSEELRKLLVASAEKSGLSLTEEAELRLKRDFAWEATKQDIEQMKRDAIKWRDADHLNVLRLVGYQILRETDGRPARLVVDLQSLLAEADGIARGLRSGFVDDNAPGSSPSAGRTADEERRLLEELEQIKRRIDEATERTRAADEAAKKSGKVA